MCRRPNETNKVDTTTDSNSLREPLLQNSQQYDEVGSLALSDKESINPNVRLTLLYTLVVFAGRSLWSQSVLSTYVYILQNKDPRAVGFISAAMGLTQLLVSFPAGVLSDRYRRDYMLKTASFIGILAIIMTYTAVHVKRNFEWLAMALSVWGVFWGISDPSLSALFADSIPDGHRSKFFTQRSILLKLGNMTGPITALVLFACLGNEWTLQDCAAVMCVGNAFCIPAVIILLFLRDDYQIDEVNDSTTQLFLSRSSSETDVTISSGNEQAPTSELSKRWLCIPEHRITPIMICTADILSGLGLGMSIRYFPIFFLENLKLSPVLVQILYILSPMGQAILMYIGQRLSLSLGRCKMTIIYKWTGVAFMAGMIAAYHWNLPCAIVCAFFVLRTSFVNATSALTKSVLMDSVPKEERGKWSSLESINMFGWSGSAILGGILVGKKGLIFNFIVTAIIQLIATFPILTLLSRDGIEGMVVEHGSHDDVFSDDGISSDECSAV